MSELDNRPAAPSLEGDDGLTIVELMIALLIVMIAFAALAGTLLSSFSAVRSNEAQVQATALGNELIEELATVPWSLLGLYEDDVPTDESGVPIEEFEGELVVQLPEPADPPGRHSAVPEAQRQFNRDGRVYTVERWVTWHVEDVGPNLKRMIVIITWESEGREQTLRTEGLRSPDPDDLLDLEIISVAIENDTQPELDEKVELYEPGATDGDGDLIEFKNKDAVRITVVLGEENASAQISFRDRNGDQHILTAPETGGGTVTREFLIAQGSYEFPHGNVTITATASGAEGGFATLAGVGRFYQPVQVQAYRLFQDGSPVSVVEACNGELVGDAFLEAEVWGLTPAEAAIDDALLLEWGERPPGRPSDVFNDPGPVPPLEMEQIGPILAGGDFRSEVVPAGTDVGGANALRLSAQRRLGEFNDDGDYIEPHPLDDDDFRNDRVISEVCA